MIVVAVASRGVDLDPDPADRLGVHAAAVGGRPALHAHDLSRASPSPRPRSCCSRPTSHPHLPGGGVGLRQGRAGRDRHRPRAALHDRDHDRPQGSVRVAAGDDEGEAHRGDGPGDPVPGPHQRLDDAHQDPHRHALHRHQDPGGHQDRRARPERARAHRQGDRGDRQAPAGDPLRLRRAGHGRELPRLRRQPRGGGPLRAQRRRRPGRHPVGDRRHERLLDGRGPRALPDQRPVPAGAARRRQPPAGDPRGHPERRSRCPSGRSPRSGSRQRPPGHQVRERPPQRLGLRGPAGHRRGHLGGAGPPRGGGAGRAARRIHDLLVRPVRVHGAGEGAPAA